MASERELLFKARKSMGAYGGGGMSKQELAAELAQGMARYGATDKQISHAVYGVSSREAQQQVEHQAVKSQISSQLEQARAYYTGQQQAYQPLNFSSVPTYEKTKVQTITQTQPTMARSPTQPTQTLQPTLTPKTASAADQARAMYLGQQTGVGIGQGYVKPQPVSRQTTAAESLAAYNKLSFFDKLKGPPGGKEFYAEQMRNIPMTGNYFGEPSKKGVSLLAPLYNRIGFDDKKIFTSDFFRNKATEQYSRGRSEPGLGTMYENIVGGAKGLGYGITSRGFEAVEYAEKKPFEAYGMATAGMIGGDVLGAGVGWVGGKVAPGATATATNFLSKPLSKGAVKVGERLLWPGIMTAQAPKGERARTFLEWGGLQEGGIIAGKAVEFGGKKIGEYKAAKASENLNLDIQSLTTERGKSVGFASETGGSKSIRSQVRTSASVQNPILGDRSLFTLEAEPKINIVGRKGKYGGQGTYDYTFSKINEPIVEGKTIISSGVASQKQAMALTPEFSITGKQSMSIGFKPSRYDTFRSDAFIKDMANIAPEKPFLLEYKGKAKAQKGAYPTLPEVSFSEAQIRDVTGVNEFRLEPLEEMGLKPSERFMGFEQQSMGRIKTTSRKTGQRSEFADMFNPENLFKTETRKVSIEPTYSRTTRRQFNKDITSVNKPSGSMFGEQLMLPAPEPGMNIFRQMKINKASRAAAREYNPYDQLFNMQTIGQRTGARVESPLINIGGKELFSFKEASLAQETGGGMSQKLAAQQMRLFEKIQIGRAKGKLFQEQGAGAGGEFDVWGGGAAPSKIETIFDLTRPPKGKGQKPMFDMQDIFSQKKPSVTQAPKPEPSMDIPSDFRQQLKQAEQASKQAARQAKQEQKMQDLFGTAAKKASEAKAGELINIFEKQRTRDVLFKESKATAKAQGKAVSGLGFSFMAGLSTQPKTRQYRGQGLIAGIMPATQTSPLSIGATRTGQRSSLISIPGVASIQQRRGDIFNLQAPRGKQGQIAGLSQFQGVDIDSVTRLNQEQTTTTITDLAKIQKPRTDLFQLQRLKGRQETDFFSRWQGGGGGGGFVPGGSFWTPPPPTPFWTPKPFIPPINFPGGFSKKTRTSFKPKYFASIEATVFGIKGKKATGAQLALGIRPMLSRATKKKGRRKR